MVYTVTLANSYGRLISELKRQIETVIQAAYLGRALGNMEGTCGRRSLSPPPLFTLSCRRPRTKSSWPSELWH